MRLANENGEAVKCQSIHYAILNAQNRTIGNPLPHTPGNQGSAVLDIDTGEPTRPHHVPTETTDWVS